MAQKNAAHAVLPLVLAVQSIHRRLLCSDEVWQAARDFKPDLVFTVAGSWNWTARLAQRVARRLGVPLVASFNDWFDFGVLMHPYFRCSLEKTFREFYRDCDLAFCTSEGMLEALGPHPNAHVLYPIGTRMRNGCGEFVPFMSNNRPSYCVICGITFRLVWTDA